MDAIALFSQIWPGFLGAAMTAFVIYLALRGMTASRSDLVGLKWPAEAGESSRQEAGTPERRLEA